MRLILGDQLTHDLASLRDYEDGDTILMVEVIAEATYVRHHKKKIAFLFSAMRHFADELKAKGKKVHYIRLDDRQNSGSFGGEVRRFVTEWKPDRLILTEPGEWRVMEMFQQWREELSCPVEIHDDDRFLCPLETFNAWAASRKTLRMEYFYRAMRQRHKVLMQGDAPEGGQWNYDEANRERLPDHIHLPEHPAFKPDEITQDVLKLVKTRFPHHFGTLEGFDMPTTRMQALHVLGRFIDQRLPLFGRYQDAMKQGEPKLFHSLLSAVLNCGLLTPLEIIRRAEHAYHSGHAPLNSVEGFIRQILGWREYVRGTYWHFMPGYAQTNELDAERPLPDFYWTGETDMNCLAQVIGETHQNAHAHHIQRLMVTGNFALLAGVRPAELEEWYLAVYADAYDWVELPNTHGMVAYADGGLMASKPYAASGAYIDKMSDYCRSCRYKVKEKSGPDACPFNFLYWDFLVRNAETLRKNQRLSVIYGNLARMDEKRRAEIRRDASMFLNKLKPWISDKP